MCRVVFYHKLQFKYTQVLPIPGSDEVVIGADFLCHPCKQHYPVIKVLLINYPYMLAGCVVYMWLSGAWS